MNVPEAAESEPSYLARPVSQIGGEITVPGDKSISHRALLLGAVADGDTHVTGFLRSDDCLATLGALRALGVAIEDAGSTLCIHGRGFEGLKAPSAPLDLGNSGTAIRLLAGLLAGQPFNSELTGDESLRQRPMERVAAPLRAMGARVETRGGRAPLRITGSALHGISWELPVASAQVKSALLLAGLSAQGRTVVRSPARTRDHTERMLAGMGVPLEEGRQGCEVALNGPATLKAIDLEVPGDFSSAAFFMVAACLRARDGLLIRNVGVNPTRTGLLVALRAMGADIELRAERTCGTEPVADLFVRQSELKGIELAAELVPLAIDELPILFIAAAGAHGRTVVQGAEELRHKESDRLSVMAEGLKTLGVKLEERPDGMVIEGDGHFGAGTVTSHGDHRIAMAFAVAAALAQGPVRILDTRLVATSFPGFRAAAQAIGLRVDALETGQ